MRTIATIKEKFQNRLIHWKNVKRHLKFRAVLTRHFHLGSRDGITRTEGKASAEHVCVKNEHRIPTGHKRGNNVKNSKLWRICISRPINLGTSNGSPRLLWMSRGGIHFPGKLHKFYCLLTNGKRASSLSMETITHTPVDAGIDARLRVMAVAFTVRSATARCTASPCSQVGLLVLAVRDRAAARGLGFVQSPLVNTGFKKL